MNLLREELNEMSMKIYKYYFSNNKKPISIEAVSRQAANHALQQIIPTLEQKGYNLRELVDVKVETPIVGVTTKKQFGNLLVWTSEGWLPKP
jgi:acetyl-CoA carboxylase carboxyltransferase component